MKKCKQGYYYCYKDKKCKKIPTGYRVGLGGWLRKEKEEEKSDSNNGTETNGDSTESNGKTNGNGNGGAVSEGWSEKYKRSIDCKNPKGFSQRAHCQGKKKVNEAKEKGDHEVSMAQTQLKKSEENIKKLRKALGTKEKNIPAWVQAKITDTEHNTDAASSYMEEGKRDGKSAKDKDYSLRDWFKGGGWVQAGGKYDGKPCARQPGQKTKPFCRDADDRAAMSKDERERRAKKKRREDPNPDRKGKAKNVTEVYDTRGTKYKTPEDALKATKEFKKQGGEIVKPAPVKLANSFSNWRQELELSEEGKKDACYHKVKSRYSVWPSAYASGALVKCRKVGAKNWGNKTKNESYEYSNWRDDFTPTDYETIDLIKAEPLVVNEYKEGDKIEYSKKTQELIDRANETPIQKLGRSSKETGNRIQLKAPRNPLTLPSLTTEAKKCWKGYEKKGTQKLFGKTYNRCVKKEEFSSWRDEISEVHRPPAGWKPYGGREKGPVPEVDATANRIDAIRRSIKTVKTVKEDWQKANRKDGVDGMSQKSVDAYKRENPGSKLKTAVTGKVKKGSKDAKRRKSFCARSRGWTGERGKAARRRWKC